MTEPVRDVSAPARARATGDVIAEASAMVQGELRAVEGLLRELLDATVPVIPRLGGHLAFAGGKRFRPLATLLVARAAGLELPQRATETVDTHVTIAAVGELLHTATLLHDDVIDSGEFRRGRPAARLEFGNGLAVLAGDYCLARAIQAVVQTGHMTAVQTLSDTVTRMAEGEVEQLALAGDCDTGEDRYYRVIGRKTADLIAWCTSIGGLLPAPQREALWTYGHDIGLAFQIADDVLDYTADVPAAGKRRGQDLRDGKMTLPLLIAMEREPALREQTRALLAVGHPVDEQSVLQLIDRVIAIGGTEAATRIAERHADTAIARLREHLPPSPARDVLIELSRHVARRRS